MKPHRLIMKAFGPFAEKTVVDFDAMGNSIYLICGDTGSGKTTIFDGIMYALYGTASGGARSALGTEAFHSDYAKAGERRDEMSVELSFSNADRTYTVFRRMYWGKKGSANRPSKESVLSENETVLLTGRGREDVDDVTSKVKEILGLDADQFRRIIMLAQGEFQRFLTAKSEERGVILGKLYDNRRHQDLQLRLKAAEVLLKKQDEDLVREAQVLLEGFVFPEDEDAVKAETTKTEITGTDVPEVNSAESSIKEDRQCVRIDHPDLIPATGRILARMQTECEFVRGSIHEQEKLVKELEEGRTKAESGNRLLDDLDRSGEKLSVLDQKLEGMNAIRTLLARAQAAEKVLPFEQTMLQAQSDFARVLARIRTLEQEREELSESAVRLEKRSAFIQQKNAPLAAAIQEKRSSLQSVLHFYEDLDAGCRILDERQNARKEAEENLSKAREALDKEQAKQKDLEQKLQALSTAGEYAVSAAKRSLDDLTLRHESLQKVYSGIDQERVYAKEEERLFKCFQDAQRLEVLSETRHLHLNRALIRGQAGILARDLIRQLEKEDVVICPVCGTSHTAADISSFAQTADEIPTQEMVDAAYGKWDQARSAAGKAKEVYLAAKGAHEQHKEWLFRLSVELMGVPDTDVSETGVSETDASKADISRWDALLNSTALSSSIETCREQLDKARRQYDRAKADQTAKEKAQSEKKKADAGVILAKETAEQAECALKEAELAAARAATSVSNWKAQLEGYPVRKEEALDKIRELTERVDALMKETEDAASEFSGCQKRQAENAGSLAAACEEKLTRQAAEQEAEKHFSEALKEWSFEGAGEYHLALTPDKKTNSADLRMIAQELAQWIRLRETEIKQYDLERRDLTAKILQLEELTKGTKRVDLQALAAQIRDASLVLEELRAKEKRIDAKIRTDQKILDRLSVIMKKREEYEAAYEKLGPLADTANGNYAFSRYVLSGFFRRIVEQANVHLDTMTDGEYQLVATEEGDRRSSLGLGLRILNTLTGLERETASLSGGQMFEASLSLALGLSDIVQMESASTIRIDSMFIDEGFGSLDGARLDKAMEVLQRLSGGKRQIGIISHVARLDECLPRKIHVISGGYGSTVRIEADI